VRHWLAHLPVVLLAVDGAAVALGSLAQVAALGGRHYAIGAGSLALGREASFAAAQASSFARSQLARSHPLPDAGALSLFAGAHGKRTSLGVSGAAE
jgi:hypothetical protein